MAIDGELKINGITITLIEYNVYRCNQCIGDIPCYCMTGKDCIKPTGCLYHTDVNAIWNLVKGDKNGI